MKMQNSNGNEVDTAAVAAAAAAAVSAAAAASAAASAAAPAFTTVFTVVSAEVAPWLVSVGIRRNAAKTRRALVHKRDVSILTHLQKQN